MNSLDEDRVWLYRLVPAGRQMSRIVQRRDDVHLVVAGADFHAVLLRQAQAAIARAAGLRT